VRFWDSSALVPLVSVEESTPSLSALLDADRGILVSFITSLEVESAVWRKARVNRDPEARQRSLERLAFLRRLWIIDDDYEAVLDEARTIVGRRGLRAGDAIQLASAIHIRGESTLSFVVKDQDLAAAARAEGFPVLP
jgi:predicted nucleic acid-binding protein